MKKCFAISTCISCLLLQLFTNAGFLFAKHAQSDNEKVLFQNPIQQTNQGDFNYGRTTNIEDKMNAKAPKKGVSIVHPHKPILQGDQTTKLQAIFDNTTDDSDKTWISNHPDILEIDQNGRISAKQIGKAMITVLTNKGKRDTCELEVVALSDGIMLNQENVTLEIHTSYTLLPITLSGDNANQTTMTWTSSNPDVAKVENGVITGLKNGTAIITATAHERRAMCHVRVRTTLNDLTLNAKTLQLSMHETAELTPTFLPSSASNQKLKWTSNNEHVATIEQGVVKAVGKGTTILRAESSDGPIAQCVVSVNAPVTAIGLHETELKLERGMRKALQANVSPSNADNQKTVWKSSDPNIAEVDEYGNVTAIANGTTDIIVKSKENLNIQAKCNVIVRAPIHSLSFQQQTITLDLHHKLTLTPNIEPANSHDVLQWITSDASIVDVNQNGVINAKGVGTATIIVKTPNGLQAASQIHVQQPIQTIQLKSSLTLRCNDQFQLHAELLPLHTTMKKTITWSSSDDTILHINEKGIVHALKSGYAKIIAKTVNGKTAECEVYVKQPLQGISFNDKQLHLKKGKAMQLKLNMKPADTSDQYQIQWFVNHPKTVQLNNEGKVFALASGQVVISAKVTLDTGEILTASVRIIVDDSHYSKTKLTYEAALKIVNDPIVIQTAPEPFMNVLLQSIDAAKSILDKGEALAETRELLNADKTLKTAMSYFDLIPYLQKINELQKIETSLYDVSTSKAFQLMSEKAQSVCNDPLAYAKEIKETSKAYQRAYQAMILLDNKALKNEITVSKSINLSDYVKSKALTDFETARKDAIAALDQTTNQAFENAIVALKDARTRLIKKADDTQVKAITKLMNQIQSYIHSNAFDQTQNGELLILQQQAKEMIQLDGLNYQDAQTFLNEHQAQVQAITQQKSAHSPISSEMESDKKVNTSDHTNRMILLALFISSGIAVFIYLYSNKQTHCE